MMKDRIQLKALAKINLGLDVLRRREDGYHEVKMIMQTISLHDDLEIRRIKTPEIQVKTIFIICRPMRTIWSIRQQTSDGRI